MTAQSLHIPPLLFYLLSLQLFHSSIKGSSHWKLDPASESILEMKTDSSANCSASMADEFVNVTSLPVNSNRVFAVLKTRKIVDSNTGYWTIVGFSKDEEKQLEHCPENDRRCIIRTMFLYKEQQPPPKAQSKETSSSTFSPEKRPSKEAELQLDCGKPISNTIYDHLAGISNRSSHRSLVEPEVAVIFKKKGTNEVDMNMVEKELRKKPKSVHLYNQIGNFWRVKGNTLLAIECFRKALYVAPNSADVLLNLARVLFNLKYLDDAIYLTRRSLEIAAPTRNVWLQHFTLGEIFESYGSKREAILHYRQALEFNSAFQPAKSHLENLEEQAQTSPTFTAYTLIVVVLLIACLALGVLSSFELGMDLFEARSGATPGAGGGGGQQRHFNRALAMRSIKFGLSSSATPSCRFKRK